MYRVRQDGTLVARINRISVGVRPLLHALAQAHLLVLLRIRIAVLRTQRLWCAARCQDAAFLLSALVSQAELSRLLLHVWTHGEVLARTILLIIHDALEVDATVICRCWRQHVVERGTLANLVAIEVLGHVLRHRIRTIQVECVIADACTLLSIIQMPLQVNALVHDRARRLHFSLANISGGTHLIGED